MSEVSAEFLLINNNNTRTKFALGTGDHLTPLKSMISSELTAETVAGHLKGFSWEKVVLASVVPSNIPALKALQDGKPFIEISHEIALGVEVDFPAPATIGADRLANAAAVAGRFPGEAVVVVDFGTAVTFDIIDARPAYVGGVIAPGLDAMNHYLHQRTALLPEIEIVRPGTAIGKSTVEAMQSGAFHGYRGLVREILEQIQLEMEGSAKVIATGGYAALIADDFAEIESVEPLLTMHGLLKVAHLNFSS
ncbi:MAG: type III pantothenate kinase [Verrucomicrobiales bacterium]|nr:type III pantothenate kinase [Verrucomicrobiales bacterium]